MNRNLIVLNFELMMQDAYAGGCFASPSEFARIAHVSANTLKKIRNGQPIRDATARKLAAAVNEARQKLKATRGNDAPILEDLEYSRWTAAVPDVETSEIERTASGRWLIQATDVEVPDHFEYASGPKQLQLTLSVTQDGRRLTAKGIDQDGDPVEAWEAEFAPDWNFISGRHAIRSPRVYLNGVFFLKYMGLRMKGYYIQRETDHDSDIVFGKLELTYLDAPR